MSIENKSRCQSCGMPLSKEFGNYGTQSDGSIHEEYCSICYCDGNFTQPEQTLEQMIASSIDNMVSEVGIPKARAEELAKGFIPTLKRWQS